MKKLMLTSIITLSVGLGLALVAAIVNSITWGGFFSPTTLAIALFVIGYLMAAISAVVVVAVAVTTVVKGGDNKKLLTSSIVIASIGAFAVIAGAILGSIGWTAFPGVFNPANANGLISFLSTFGFLTIVLSGIVLVSAAVSNAVKGESKDKK